MPAVCQARQASDRRRNRKTATLRPSRLSWPHCSRRHRSTSCGADRITQRSAAANNNSLRWNVRPAMRQPLQSQNQLDSRLRTVWRRGQTLHVTAGMLAFYRWGILLFLIGMAIDWMTHMPAPGRIGILVTLLAVSVYKAWNCGWRYCGCLCRAICRHAAEVPAFCLPSVIASGNHHHGG